MSGRVICGHEAIAGHCDQCDEREPPILRSCREVGCGCLTHFKLTIETSDEEELRRHVDVRELEAAISGFAEELRQVSKHGEGQRQEEAQHWRGRLSDYFCDRGLGHLL